MAPTELFPTGRSKQPLALTLSDANEVFLVKDNVGITIDIHSGGPTRKFGTSLTDLPLQIGYASPYIVSLHPNMVEVHNPSIHNGLCQTVPLTGAERMSSAPVSNMDAGALRAEEQQRDMLFVATADNSLYLLDLVDFYLQVRLRYLDPLGT